MVIHTIHHENSRPVLEVKNVPMTQKHYQIKVIWQHCPMVDENHQLGNKMFHKLIPDSSVSHNFILSFAQISSYRSRALCVLRSMILNPVLHV